MEEDHNTARNVEEALEPEALTFNAKIQLFDRKFGRVDAGLQRGSYPAGSSTSRGMAPQAIIEQRERAAGVCESIQPATDDLSTHKKNEDLNTSAQQAIKDLATGCGISHKKVKDIAIGSGISKKEIKDLTTGAHEVIEDLASGSGIAQKEIKDSTTGISKKKIEDPTTGISKKEIKDLSTDAHEAIEDLTSAGGISAEQSSLISEVTEANSSETHELVLKTSTTSIAGDFSGIMAVIFTVAFQLWELICSVGSSIASGIASGIASFDNINTNVKVHGVAYVTRSDEVFERSANNAGVHLTVVKGFGVRNSNNALDDEQQIENIMENVEAEEQLVHISSPKMEEVRYESANEEDEASNIEEPVALEEPDIVSCFYYDDTLPKTQSKKSLATLDNTSKEQDESVEKRVDAVMNIPTAAANEAVQGSHSVFHTHPIFSPEVLYETRNEEVGALSIEVPVLEEQDMVSCVSYDEDLPIELSKTRTESDENLITFYVSSTSELSVKESAKRVAPAVFEFEEKFLEEPYVIDMSTQDDEITVNEPKTLKIEEFKTQEAKEQMPALTQQKHQSPEEVKQLEKQELKQQPLEKKEMSKQYLEEDEVKKFELEKQKSTEKVLKQQEFEKQEIMEESNMQEQNEVTTKNQELIEQKVCEVEKQELSKKQILEQEVQQQELAEKKDNQNLKQEKKEENFDMKEQDQKDQESNKHSKKQETKQSPKDKESSRIQNLLFLLINEVTENEEEHEDTNPQRKEFKLFMVKLKLQEALNELRKQKLLECKYVEQEAKWIDQKKKDLQEHELKEQELTKLEIIEQFPEKPQVLEKPKFEREEFEEQKVINADLNREKVNEQELMKEEVVNKELKEKEVNDNPKDVNSNEEEELVKGEEEMEAEVEMRVWEINEKELLERKASKRLLGGHELTEVLKKRELEGEKLHMQGILEQGKVENRDSKITSKLRKEAQHFELQMQESNEVKIGNEEIEEMEATAKNTEHNLRKLQEEEQEVTSQEVPKKKNKKKNKKKKNAAVKDEKLEALENKEQQVHDKEVKECKQKLQNVDANNQKSGEKQPKKQKHKAQEANQPKVQNNEQKVAADVKHVEEIELQTMKTEEQELSEINAKEKILKQEANKRKRDKKKAKKKAAMLAEKEKKDQEEKKPQAEQHQKELKNNNVNKQTAKKEQLKATESAQNPKNQQGKAQKGNGPKSKNKKRAQ